MPSPQRQEKDDEVVRITTNLVQVDAVVTDRDGNQVTDLDAADFEILENGRPQPITNFSYITTAAPTANATGTSATANATGTSAKASPAASPATGRAAAPPTLPTAPLRPEQVRRAVALVVDDLRMSAEGIASTRNALRKYVDEQLQPGDLVAIIRTSAGIGALQQFTSDRRQLHAAIERVRLLTRSGARLGAFTSVDTLESLETQVTAPAMEKPGEEPESETERAQRKEVDRGGLAEGLKEFRDTLFTVGTIGALNYVVRGLKELPGRKAVVLFSDGISIFDSNSDSQDRNERVLGALRQLIDHASRASVVFYPIDTRGLQPSSPTAADNTSGSPAAPFDTGPGGSLSGVVGMRPDMIGQQVLGQRSGEMFEGQNGLNYLARETGGLALFNNNNLNRGIRRALEDISGYYLIGYRPEESTFDPGTGKRRYHTWTVKVKNRPNLRVRARGGFLGVAENETRDQPRPRAEQLMAALLSPFSAGGVHVQLTSFFINEALTGSTMRSVVLMDARNLTFTPQPDGQLQSVLDIIAVTFGEDGQVVDQVSRVETIRARPAAVQRFLREGIAYGLNVPVTRPGAYQLRIAVRDAATGRVGSASQYVEVPKVVKDRIALSSLVISGDNPGAGRSMLADDMIRSVLGGMSPSAASATRLVAGGEGMVGAEDPQAGPASRRFRHGMFLNYACIVYNARTDKAKRPQLTTQVRLFREGQEVFTGEVLPLEVNEQTDAARLLVARRLQLGSVLAPGDYVLHLTVTDTLASGNQRTTAGWIDFKLDN
jgi:VWFA-related protein